jgi:phosphatidate cytidylyltransferase
MEHTAAATMLSTRIRTALVLFPLVLAAIFLLSPLGWGLVTLAAMLVAAFEWTRLVRARPPVAITFVVGALVLALALLFVPAVDFGRGWPAAVIVAVCAPAALFWAIAAPAWLRSGWATSSPYWMTPIGWIIFVGAWAALVQLQAASPATVLAAMATVWIADTAAYFVGRAFGRHKLAPAISPGKTWEGVYGALAAVAVYALALWPVAGRAGWPSEAGVVALLGWIAAALALAALSVVGDLFESLLKRQAGVKDSGRILPGHGGLLDRIDALLAAMPAAALLSLVYHQ